MNKEIKSENQPLQPSCQYMEGFGFELLYPRFFSLCCTSYVELNPSFDKSPVRLPGAIENFPGQSEDLSAVHK